jgi:hypothetical protein
MAYPLTLATRFFDQGTVLPRGEAARRFLNRRFLAAALLGPTLYVVLRIFLESSPATRSAEGIGFPPIAGHEWDYFRGAWAAWRFAWLAVPACWVSLWPALRASPAPAALIAGYWALTFLSVAAGMFTAYDTSRAGAVIAPVILVGLRFLATSNGFPFGWRYCVVAIALANLLLPTAHGIIGMTDPIRPLPTELSMLRNPPPAYDAHSYAAHSLTFARNGDGLKAARALALAERLGPIDGKVVAVRAFFTAVQQGSEAAIGFLVQRCKTEEELVFASSRLRELLLDAGERERAGAIAAALERLAERPLAERPTAGQASPESR